MNRRITVEVQNKWMWENFSQSVYPTKEEIETDWLPKLSKKFGSVIAWSQPLHDKFVNRMKHLSKTLKAKSKGGRQRIEFLMKDWNLVIESSDVVFNEKLEEDNEKLRRRVSELEAQVTEVKRSKPRLEVEEKKGRGRKRSLMEYSDRQKRRLKKQRTESCEMSLSWLESEGYTPLEVVVQDKRKHTIETITMPTTSSNEESAATEDNLMEDETLMLMLYIKERYTVSHAAYHEMAKACKELPRQSQLQKKIKELNDKWEIFPLPNDVPGVQQKLEPRLKDRIEQMIATTPDNAEFKEKKKIRVKLSGDGTKIGKRIHVINFTYTLLDEGDKAYSYEGNHPLAIFKASEAYESLKSALEDIITDVVQLRTITIGSEEYEIEYFLGGDWKFLAIVTGIDSASSNYSCIWCKCSTEERMSNPEKVWSLMDADKGARTVEESITIALSKSKKNRYNVSHSPLFPNIPLKNVVIDNLHLFLRVSDVLFDLLVIELKRQDAIDKTSKFSNFNISKYSHLKGLEEFISSLKIPDFSFYVGRMSKALKCRSLTGPEKIKVISNVSIANLLPKLSTDKVHKIQALWDGFLKLHKIFSKRPEELQETDKATFQDKSRAWVDDFIAVYHITNITPYMHAMANHVPEFLKLHGSILPFTQQGLEKYNDISTKIYFRSTNHRGTDALKQIMQKQNRLEYLH